MGKSNVVIGSNVYHSKTEDPRRDGDFVRQIQDVEKLKKIKKAREADQRIAELQEEQEDILEKELRCVYCKNDPCFGYVKSLRKIVCKCINGSCPKIKKCNPDYTDQYASEWQINEEDIQAYGDPQGLRRYYLVNLPSSEELEQYEVTPENGGKNFKTIQKVSFEKENTESVINIPETRIDPETGRIQMIVGFGDWRIDDNADYQSEELPPIWGYVEEYIEKYRPEIKKAKKIQKKKATKQYITEKEIQLSDLIALAMDIEPLDIICDNPAELSVISSNLISYNIDHGFDEGAKIRLILRGCLPKPREGRIGIFSSESLKPDDPKQNDQVWRQIQSYDKSYFLNYAGRQYYNYTSDFVKSRWCCKNMYGITHICIENGDIQDLNDLEEGDYPIYLKENEDSFSIIDEKAGRKIGKMTNWFYEFVKDLVKTNEISAFPEKIDGITLRTHHGELSILGIGHLVILEDYY